MKRGVIGARHLRSGAVGANEIADGSLGTDKLGLQIASGDPLIIGPGEVGTVKVTCPDGMQVLGPYAINWSGSNLPGLSLQSIAIGESELLANGYNGAGDPQAFFASAVCIPGGAIPNN